MSYSLNTIILVPLSKKKAKSAVILCHGYGGDGKDISILANYWRAHLPNTIFICPDAPEKCAESPTGFQWFDLMDQKPDQVLSKSLVAESKLNKLIDEVKDKNNLLANQIVIGGFSQGCMISLQTGIKRKDTIGGILGYSGRIIDTEHLEKNTAVSPRSRLLRYWMIFLAPLQIFPIGLLRLLLFKIQFLILDSSPTNYFRMQYTTTVRYF